MHSWFARYVHRLIILAVFSFSGFISPAQAIAHTSDSQLHADVNASCPVVQSTPSFTFAYGTVTLDGQPAPMGTTVIAYSPRGTMVGCSEVTTVGLYGSMFIYGEDNSVTPAIPGMRAGEQVTFRVSGGVATNTPALLWANDREVHQIGLAATAPTAVAPSLSLQKIGSDIKLTWLSNPANQSYAIHRSVTPFFTSNATTLLTTLSTGATTYTDPNAVIASNASYFYTVRAISGASSADSNGVGAINYALNNAGGKYSLIAIPMAPSGVTNAASLANYIGHVGALLKWNPATQSFRFFAPPNSGDNFTLTLGDVVFVLITIGGPNVVTIMGNVSSVSYALTARGFTFLSLPLQKSNLTNAAAIAGDITGVQALLAWNESTQTFRFFAPPGSGDNFVAWPGMPFVVSMGTAGPPSWPVTN